MDGVSPDGRVVVVAAQEIGGAGPDPAHDDRLVSLLVEHLRAYRWNATATTMDGRAYVLVELHEEAARSSLGHILDDCLIRASRSLGVPLKAGLSDELTVDSDLPAGKLQADQCLDLSPTESSVVFFEDVQARVLLSDIKQFVAGRRSAVTPAFQRLIDHDREYHTEYVPTLRAYFDGFGDTAVVGAQMHVHNNTVRYRLRRIAELSQVDLGDPESRLALQLQIYAHDN
ncbi:PucR family transcriptional regulator [Agromyces aerolatus]|uniref:PucR family transcriptional regulator n=2 Tax=Agromyces sp. LY-1074 TaxID=3074080 RepID=UPI00286752DF|nr:helix-turn-helix domain-containing protein [Agromyces sp. LY-1358]MDR5707373.1 helix-turn-helix domain-containing protein [Agromyces sp. LY-1358]